MPVVHYVCSVLPPEPEVLGTDIDPETGELEVLVPAKPQRAKVADLTGYSAYAADIPTDPTTGLALKSWCIVAVEAAPTVHTQLAKDADMWPFGPGATEKLALRAYLESKGETAPADEPQAVLERLHPLSDHGHVPQIANLRAG